MNCSFWLRFQRVQSTIGWPQLWGRTGQWESTEELLHLTADRQEGAGTGHPPTTIPSELLPPVKSPCPNVPGTSKIVSPIEDHPPHHMNF
jgi:hypothetical protein